MAVLKLSGQSDTPLEDMQRCKERLERILEHWDNPELGGFYTHVGLCSNVFHGYLNYEQREIMFNTWEHFNGDKHYPVEGKAQYYRTVDKFTPERKSLAEHCLKLITELLEEIKMSKRISKHDHRIERIAEHTQQGKQFVVLAKSVEHITQVLSAALNSGYEFSGVFQPAQFQQALHDFPEDVVISFYPATKRMCVNTHRCGCTPVDIERPKRTFQDRCDKLLRKIVNSGKCAAVPVSSQEHCDALFKAARKVGLPVDPEDYWTTFKYNSIYVLLYPLGSGIGAGVYNHDGGYDLYNRPKE